MIIGLASIGALGASFLLTGWLSRFFRDRRIIDLPNDRSSHTRPTPRGGGLSIVVVTSAAVLALYHSGQIAPRFAGVILVGGLGIAAIGFWDDVTSASVRVRIGIHIAAAMVAILLLGTPTSIQFGHLSLHLGNFGALLGILSVVWTLNLFNFMDGIDGIAGAEAAFVLLSAAFLNVYIAHSNLAAIAPALIAGAACLGFLWWNWPPASIFMGDVGSGYVGYLIAVIAIQWMQTSALSLFTWMILGGVFLVDATLTLIKRLLRRERVFDAHRTHAYQHLARLLNSHARVTTAVAVVNVLWLLPCAWLTIERPILAPWICLLALLPLAVLCHVSGSGRPEARDL